jgi:putative hydrolase of the HAD superfamily
MTRALVFDLDETLVVEEPAAVAAFEATARFAGERCGADVPTLAVGARGRARELWRAAPTYPYCRRIGMSSWDGLWCRFLGAEPDARALREFAPGYRTEAWRLALLDQGVDDRILAQELGERFGSERRAGHQVFPDAEPALAELAGSYSLALLTNGASCLQREKLEASGLGGYFDVVVASADLGVGKPDPSVFARATSALGARAQDAVMIGDSVGRDVAGALDAGLGAVWLNREGRPRPPELSESVIEIGALSELPAALAGAAGASRAV